MRARTARRIAASIGATLFVLSASADISGHPGIVIGCLIASGMLTAPTILHALLTYPHPPRAPRPPEPNTSRPTARKPSPRALPKRAAAPRATPARRQPHH